MSGSNSNLMLAILSLDSYNRGYNAQLNVSGQSVGDAIVINTADLLVYGDSAFNSPWSSRMRFDHRS